MKNLLTILLLIVVVNSYGQSRIVNSTYSNGQFGKKLTLNSVVAQSPISITTGGGTDTIKCETCGTGSGTVNASAQKIAIGRSSTTLTYSNAFYDTTKFWLGLNTITPAGVLHIYPNFPGTVTTTSASTSVTGTGTLFLSNFQPGDSITFNGTNRIVSTITDNTTLTLTATAGANNTNVAYVNASTNRGLLRADENDKVYKHGRLFMNTVPLWAVTSFGLDALQNNTQSGNTAFGYRALQANTTSFGNTAVGSNALAAVTTTSGANTAVGYNALTANTASDNTAVGYTALSANTSGARNTAFGRETLTTNISGTENTAVGSQALRLNTSTGNTAVGYTALTTNAGGNSNTGIGWAAITANTSGNQNTGVGYGAMTRNTTGGLNTALGFRALDSNTTASNNVAIGAQAGQKVNAGTGNITGSNSVFLGYDTRAAADAQTNQIVIGYLGVGNGSNTTTIGNSSTTDTWLGGTTKLHITLGTAPSSASDTGVAGTVIITTDYIYVCTATNTWKRTAISTW